MNKTPKEKRQKAIEEILTSESIENQEDLLLLLQEQGFNLTQATLSRDFREMKVAKTPDAFSRYYYRMPDFRLPQTDTGRYGMTSSFSRHGIINIEFSGQFAVIKTPAGYARGIASDIDTNNLAGVMGTIAGNDTVLVILRDNFKHADIITSLSLLFDNK